MDKKITMIQAQKKTGRYNIYLDGEYAFAVSESVLINYRLAKGKKLSLELIADIQISDNISKGYNKILDFLSHQMRTQKEIELKLKSLDIAEGFFDDIITKLKENHLIDDLEYAKSFVRTMYNTSDKGPQVIRTKLLQKGVSSNDIEDALILYTPELQAKNCLKLGKKLAQRYHNESFKNLQTKIKQGLITKGFSSEIANLTLEDLALELDQENEFDLLVSAGDKLWNRYVGLESKKRALKIQQALYRKGFALDDIRQYLEDKENDFED